MLRIANGSDEFIRISFLGREHLVATSREAIHRLFAAKVDEFLVPMIAITMLEGAIEHTILSAQGAEHRVRKQLHRSYSTNKAHLGFAQEPASNIPA